MTEPRQALPALDGLGDRSRRGLLRLSGLALGAAALAACGQPLLDLNDDAVISSFILAHLRLQ
jgi:hypothetical protein